MAQTMHHTTFGSRHEAWSTIVGDASINDGEAFPSWHLLALLLTSPSTNLDPRFLRVRSWILVSRKAFYPLYPCTFTSWE